MMRMEPSVVGESFRGQEICSGLFFKFCLAISPGENLLGRWTVDPYSPYLDSYKTPLQSFPLLFNQLYYPPAHLLPNWSRISKKNDPNGSLAVSVDELPKILIFR